MKFFRNGFTPLEKKFHHLCLSEITTKFRQILKPRLNFLAGFTLVELLITIAIISIIAGIGGVAFNKELPHYKLRGDTRTVASSLLMTRMKARSFTIIRYFKNKRFKIQFSNDMYKLFAWQDTYL